MGPLLNEHLQTGYLMIHLSLYQQYNLLWDFEFARMHAYNIKMHHKTMSEHVLI